MTSNTPSSIPERTRVMLLAQVRMNDPLPAGWQRRIAKTAIAAKDTDLLILLAARSDCPADVASLLAANADHRVREVAVRQSSLAPSVLEGIAETEKNSAVLAALCAKARGETQSRLAERFNAKPTVVLAHALLHADWITDATALGVLRVLGPRYPKLEAQSQARLEGIAQHLVEQGEVDSVEVVLAARGSHQLIAKLCAVPQLSPPALRVAVLELEGEAGKTSTPRGALAAKTAWGTVIKHPHALDPVVAEELDRALAEHAPNLVSIWDLMRNEDALIEKGDPAGLLELARFGSLAALKTLVEQVRDYSDSIEQAVHYGTAEGRAWLMQSFPLLDAEAQAVISKELTAECVEAGVWSHLDDPDKLHRSVLELLLAENGAAGYQPLYSRAVAYAVVACPHLLGLLPWADVMTARTRNHSGAVVASYLDKALDDNAWEYFLVLASEWTGSLDELIGACRNLGENP